MKAMVLPFCTSFKKSDTPLIETELPFPQPRADEVLIRIVACAVCHTELDEIEGRTPPAFFPIILGHQVVGTVIEAGTNVHGYEQGSPVGVGWIFSACGRCAQCLAGKENLCQHFKATGRDAQGGYAEYMLAKAAFTFPLPPGLEAAATAPLFCAGAVGYRALKLCGIKNGACLGFSGFGASAHIICNLARQLYHNLTIYAFARSKIQQQHALSLGASWAGAFNENPPALLDAIIDTTPVWAPLIFLLPHLKPGGRFVINAIRKENEDKKMLQSLSYEDHLWHEKELTSVANVTRDDIKDFLTLAKRFSIIPQVTIYKLTEANVALRALKKGDQTGAKVLVP